MGAIDEYIKKLERNLPAIREKKIYSIVAGYEQEIVELNQDQLFHGKDSNKKKLKKYRSKSYAKFKLQLNPLGVTDLKNKGDFWNGMGISSKFWPLMIDSDDLKTDKLKKKYGEAIFGLDETHKRKLTTDDAIREEIVEYFRGVLAIR